LLNVSSCKGLSSPELKNNMLKVAVIGGGSTYTPELVSGFLTRMEEFPLNELWLMDIDEERLEVVGSAAATNIWVCAMA
jgi:alpha-galactosidase/6-phospho-beta-glucosidase family protein